ncbi:prepilin signal peptidase PulO-like enzyme (type II secretory pathway) [Streptomyces brevispora]|uniref:Prepilin signal peptidase PulO-like enzyme (Type II secretory pathway) n=1 Tax=Streptomyces brevispora TaxID=887462 RepID=A0A561V6N1_9ACTN|nr:DMT family transporter [Streptomyces brevispora]TWG07269.1 prepilin signal peptidase PulO-like enzyme (type II secretory pathway) [Streptomyces brevispora]
MSSLALSVLLSLVSAVAYAAGAIVQERVATVSDGRSLAPLRNRVWWAAVALNGVGAALHVVALAYGPLSLVQPLGALTIVFALPMAALFVRRRAGATAWRGAIMASVGLAGLLALTGSSDAHTLGGPQQLMLGTVTFGAVAALVLISKAMRRPVLRSVVLAGGAGVAFGIASVFTKTEAMEWTSGSVGSGLPTLLVIAALAATGLLLSQAAYRGAGLTAPLATVTVVNPVVAAAVGITLFDEQFRHGPSGAMLALVCGVVAAGGLILLTTERMGAERRQAQQKAGGGGERQAAGSNEDEVSDASDASAAPDTTAPVPASPDATAPVASSAPAPGAFSVVGTDSGDFGGPAGSPDPAGAPLQPVRTTPTVVAFPEPAGTGLSTSETFPTPPSPPVRMTPERRVGQVGFGPAARPGTGSARRGGASAGPTTLPAAAAVTAGAAGQGGHVQTLTPAARR